MANFVDTNVYEPSVYQLSTEDLLSGGSEGISNVPMRQLANRTNYLKIALEKEHLASGEHNGAALRAVVLGNLVNSDVAVNAAIKESKVALGIEGDARPFPTPEGYLTTEDGVIINLDESAGKVLTEGAYTNTGQIAEDVMYVYTTSNMDSGVADPIISAMLATHNTDGTSHAAIRAKLNSVEASVRARYKQLIVDRVAAIDNIGTYSAGFIDDLATPDNIGAASSGYTYNGVQYTVTPTGGTPMSLDIIAPASVDLTVAPTTSLVSVVFTGTLPTVNTDLVVSVSRNGGVNWTQTTLDAPVQVLPGRYMVTAVTAFTSSSGTELAVRVYTATGVNIAVDSVGCFAA